MSTSGNSLKRTELIEGIRRALRSKSAALTEELNAIREGMANESKSSAGDKYETAREMAQQEIFRLNQVLEQTRHQLSMVTDFAVDQATISNGSFVETTSHIFYIGSPFGQLTLGQFTIFGIGPNAPVARSLSGLTAGKSFYLNTTEEIVKTIL